MKRQNRDMMFTIYGFVIGYIYVWKLIWFDLIDEECVAVTLMVTKKNWDSFVFVISVKCLMCRAIELNNMLIRRDASAKRDTTHETTRYKRIDCCCLDYLLSKHPIVSCSLMFCVAALLYCMHFGRAHSKDPSVHNVQWTKWAINEIRIRYVVKFIFKIHTRNMCKSSSLINRKKLCWNYAELLACFASCNGWEYFFISPISGSETSHDSSIYFKRLKIHKKRPKWHSFNCHLFRHLRSTLNWINYIHFFQFASNGSLRSRMRFVVVFFSLHIKPSHSDSINFCCCFFRLLFSMSS